MRKIIYWILTILFAGLMLFSGISEFFPSGIKGFIDLGYPAYISPFIGVAKILGVLAILFRKKFPTLAEWAFAGFAIDFLGAGYSIYMSGGGVFALTLIPFLAVLFAIRQLHSHGCNCCGGGNCSCTSQKTI